MLRTLGMTQRALDAAVRSNRIFALEFADQLYYPALFSDRHLALHQLAKICIALGEGDGCDKWLFLSTPKLSLGRQTPLAALKCGKFEQVLRAARGYAER